MDFVDQIKILAARVPGLLDHIKTEAATRSSLVEPFIRALGYDTSDPTEVVPEFGAHLNIPGLPRDKRVDYAVMKDGKPIILIECKCHTDKLIDGYKQLFNYAVNTECQIAILTNGLVYRFYAELDKAHLLDTTPFLEIDLRDLKEPLLDEVRYLTKNSFSIDGMLSAAQELKYVGGILQILNQQFEEPSDDFVKFFFQKVCEGRAFAGGIRHHFTGYTQRAMKQFIRDRITNMMDASGLGSPVHPKPDIQPEPELEDEEKAGKQVVTTDEEIQGFYIVKSIMCGVVDSERVFMRDKQSYCGILLDNNKLKPICRLYFNNLQNKRLALISPDKQEEKIDIERLDDIYKYADRLKATVLQYISSETAA